MNCSLVSQLKNSDWNRRQAGGLIISRIYARIDFNFFRAVTNMSKQLVTDSVCQDPFQLSTSLLKKF